MLTQKTLKTNIPIKTLSWKEDYLVDWAGGGNRFYLDGSVKQSHRGYAFRFNSAIQAPNSPYAIIYEKLGTKALILKNGEIHRELNRSYYQAGAYEYPIAFLQLPNDGLAIIHCPASYDRIDIELVESGKILTSHIEREPQDCFHTRFLVSPDQQHFINTGWVWHPFGIFFAYNTAHVIQAPELLDKVDTHGFYDEEIASAAFLDNDHIFVAITCSGFEEEEEDPSDFFLHANELGLYSLKEKKIIRKTRLPSEAGTIVALNEKYVLSLFEYPKVIDTYTGDIIQSFPNIKSGTQQYSYGYNLDQEPAMAIDHLNKRIAIKQENTIEILSL